MRAVSSPTIAASASPQQQCQRRPAPEPQLTRRQLHSALGALLLAAQPAAAAAQAVGGPRAEVQRIEQAYDSYAATYDDLDGGAAADSLGFPALRAALLRQARGDVLETAVGTGLNLPLYDAAALTSLTAIDLSRGMLGQAQARAQALRLADRIRLQLVQADVAALGAALGGCQFDTVVDTFSLCVFPDPVAALRSMAACLRPGGTLLLLEHSRSSFAPLGWYQVRRAGVCSMGLAQHRSCPRHPCVLLPPDAVPPNPCPPFEHAGRYSASSGGDRQGVSLE